MKRQPRTDTAGEISSALFDLAQRAMRDAARLTIIASQIARSRFDNGHFHLARYLALRDGNCYGREDAERILRAIEDACPALGERVAKNRKAKDQLAARMKRGAEQWQDFESDLAAGLDRRAAWARNLGAKPDSNIVRVPFGGPKDRPRGGAA
jgi:hypothetical protein